VHYLNEWGSDDLEVDVVIHLKGLSEYYPKPWNVNILWMLNHPDLHTAEELNRYDAVCVASESHAEYLRSQLVVPVFCLPQATDPDHFRPNPNTDKEFDLVFVGNNTGIGRLDMRQIVADVLPTRYKLAVWGDGWEGLLPDGVWKGEFVPWEYLPEIYSRARIVLNDHQPEMRDNGFVNNRTFDALACGAVVVSDDVRGLRRGLGVRTYRSRQELTRHIDQILGDETTAMAETEDLRQAVLQSFTFAQRVSQLAAILAQLRTAWDRTQSERGTAVSQLLANGPRVSVLMSTYNRRDLLSAAVESIRTQTYGNWELIVVNDGGEDVADLVAAAGDDRIRLINLPARRGKAAAVNVGFAASSGEYIAYLDDDDVWYTDHLQRLMLALTAVPGVRMAYSDAYNVSQQRINDGYVETDRQLIYHHQVTVGDLIAQNRIQGITVVHDRALFEEVGGMDPALRVLIDWDMWRRLAAQTYPYHVSRITADHFLREEAGTEGRGHITHLYRLNPIRYAQLRRRILRKELPLHRNSPLAVGLMHARVDADAELLRRLGEYYEERGRIAHGLRFYERAIERKSGDTAALRRLGRLHLRQGRPEQAVTCFWKCMHIQPTVEDYLHCAQAYLNMDLADDASACLAQLETQKCRMEAGLRDEVDRRQYQAWVAKHTADRGGTHEVTEYAQALGKNGPRFHVVATTNEPQVEMLADSLEALAVQRYPHWRLSVLAPFAAPAMGIDSDGRLRWLELSSAVDTETALGQVLAETGDDWVVMLRRGVRLHPNLFLAAAEHISRNPDCRLLYTDHDYFAPDGNRCDPQFKPDFNLELLRSQPYPGVACLVRADAAVTVGGLHGDGTEAWYDMALRVVECFGETAVGHVSEVLFHLPRAVPTSHSSRNESLTRDALEAHLRRCGLSATVENGLRAGTHAVFYHHAGRPKVTVIIPTRDRLDLVQPCVLSLLEKTAYINLEVLIVDNQSSDPATLKFMAQVEASDPRVRVLRYSSPYSYAAVNNFAAGQAQGDFLLLLNNDTVITQPEWLDRMLAHGQRPDVG
ncbi:MAG: glycosyltransferase, partial [Gammaproteobacteria bacterium]